MRILTAGRNVRPNNKRDARRGYREADRLACRAQVELSRDIPAVDRLALLRELAYQLQAMSKLRREVFGPTPLDDEGGRDLADSLASSALLVRLVADAEQAAVSSMPRIFVNTELEPYAGPVLARMATTPDPLARGELLDDLYDAVVDIVGEQAAETIACLPAPGHWEPVTFSQWCSAVRAGALSDRVVWRGAAIAAVLLLAWMLVGGWLGVPLAVAGFAVAGSSFPRLRPNGRKWPVILTAASYGLAIAASSAGGRAGVIVAVAGGIAAVAGAGTWAIAVRREHPGGETELVGADPALGDAEPAGTRGGGRCFIRMIECRGDEDDYRMVNLIGPYTDEAQRDAELDRLSAMPGVYGDVEFVPFAGDPIDADRVMRAQHAAAATRLEELDDRWKYTPSWLGLQIATSTAESIPIRRTGSASGTAGSGSSPRPDPSL